MNKLAINLGQGEFILYKSDHLIGVKIKSGAKTLPKELEKGKVHGRGLGGFQIYKFPKSLRRINSVLDRVRKSRNILLGTHVYFTDHSKSPIVPTGKIFVAFNHRAKIKDRKALLAALHLQQERKIDRNRMIVSVTPQSANPLKACIQLMKAKDGVVTAIPDFDSPQLLHDDRIPNDDLFPLHWHLQNKGAARGEPRGKIVKGSDLRIVDAWKRLGNKGSKEITIAIIDQSMDLQHPVYREKIVASKSIYTDAFAPLGSGHGTACASLAAGAADGEGIVGVAPNARLIMIEGSTFSWDILQRLFQFCMDKGADIISCSWGSIEAKDSLDPMHDVVLSEITRQGRNGKGCPILFSVGNENQERINHFAKHPDVIAVAGSNSADEHFSFSNRGREISVSAPAGNWPIIAARAAWLRGREDSFWTDGKIRGRIGQYKHFEGTSASCPMVAGVCALMLSAHPNLTASEVKVILEQTADKIGNKNDYVDGYSLRYGYGRVNADKAVAEAIRRADPIPVIGATDLTSGTGLFRFEVAPALARGFGVQVGVYEQYGNVLIHSDKVRRDFGHPTLVNINELDGKTVYKLILGPFDSKAKARKISKELKEQGRKNFVTDLSQFA
ncbi:MAG: S8 family serine peptidase [Bacteroidota bacterium]